MNISSPNTPGLRALQDKGSLEALLDGVAAAQPAGAAKPVFLKVAPDLEPADIDDIVAVAFEKGLAARSSCRTRRSCAPRLHRATPVKRAGRERRSRDWRSSGDNNFHFSFHLITVSTCLMILFYSAFTQYTALTSNSINTY